MTVQRPVLQEISPKDLTVLGSRKSDVDASLSPVKPNELTVLARIPAKHYKLPSNSPLST